MKEWFLKQKITKAVEKGAFEVIQNFSEEAWKKIPQEVIDQAYGIAVIQLIYPRPEEAGQQYDKRRGIFEALLPHASINAIEGEGVYAVFFGRTVKEDLILKIDARLKELGSDKTVESIVETRIKAMNERQQAMESKYQPAPPNPAEKYLRNRLRVPLNAAAEAGDLAAVEKLLELKQGSPLWALEVAEKAQKNDQSVGKKYDLVIKALFEAALDDVKENNKGSMNALQKTEAWKRYGGEQLDKDPEAMTVAVRPSQPLNLSGLQEQSATKKPKEVQMQVAEVGNAPKLQNVTEVTRHQTTSSKSNEQRLREWEEKHPVVKQSRKSPEELLEERVKNKALIAVDALLEKEKDGTKISGKAKGAALKYAARKGNEQVVKAILDHDRGISDHAKEKSIVYAKKKGHTHVADLLKANKEGKGAQKSH